MAHSEIPSAFLIRALARRDAEHCDRCGSRMFVKGRSGLCPFCLAQRPITPVAAVAALPTPGTPFAPRLAEGGGWQRIGLSQRLRERIRRNRGSSGVGARALLAGTHPETQPANPV